MQQLMFAVPKYGWKMATRTGFKQAIEVHGQELLRSIGTIHALVVHFSSCTHMRR